MAYSNISKLASQTVNNKANSLQAQTKKNPSKFDDVRARLEKPSGTAQSPALQESVKISPQERKRVEADFKKRLDEVGLRDLNEIFKTDLVKSKEKVDAVRKQLSSQPASAALDSVRARLIQVENQYLDSSRLIQGLGKVESPEDYLKVQLQMYKLSQNVELLSKIAGEVVSGVNKVLTTQV